MLRTVLMIVIFSIISGGLGFFFGRQLPAHHYIPFRGTMVIDSSTGRVCNIFDQFGNSSMDPATDATKIPYCDQE